MTPSPLLLALLTDARLPAGGHTQSAGLEAALRAGMPPDQVPDYVRARLRTVTAVEAATAVVARAVASAGGDLAIVERAWAARTPSDALRATSRRLGRGYGRLQRALAPHDDDGSWSRPVALGRLAARTGLEAIDLSRLVGYDDVQAVAAALLKLSPVDPLRVTAWVHSTLPDVEALARHTSHLERPEQIPASGAPLMDLWAQTHAASTERLFRA